MLNSEARWNLANRIMDDVVGLSGLKVLDMERREIVESIVGRLVNALREHRRPNDDMLSAAQSKLCEISSRTHFVDHEQAEMFAAMVDETLPPNSV